jgi:hypothetical protein
MLIHSTSVPDFCKTAVHSLLLDYCLPARMQTSSMQGPAGRVQGPAKQPAPRCRPMVPPSASGRSGVRTHRAAQQLAARQVRSGVQNYKLRGNHIGELKHLVTLMLTTAYPPAGPKPPAGDARPGSGGNN